MEKWGEETGEMLFRFVSPVFLTLTIFLVKLGIIRGDEKVKKEDKLILISTINAIKESQRLSLLLKFEITHFGFWLGLLWWLLGNIEEQCGIIVRI